MGRHRVHWSQRNSGRAACINGWMICIGSMRANLFEEGVLRREGLSHVLCRRNDVRHLGLNQAIKIEVILLRES